MINNLWNPLAKTNDAYAHSEEYSYLEQPYSIWGVHPTAAILGYILVLCPENFAFVKKARKQISFIESELLKDRAWTTYDFISFNSLLGSLRKMNEYAELQQVLEKRIIEEACKHIKDESFNFPFLLSNVQTEGELKAKVEEGLDKIIKNRKSHGLWENAKGWGTNRYAEADSAALKWLGAETVKNLSLLKKFGRIEL